MHDTFGVRLLHNHFELKDGEKLVEHNNHATSWKLEEGDKLVGGQVAPTAWLILKGQGLMPYELSLSHSAKIRASTLLTSSINSSSKTLSLLSKLAALTDVSGSQPEEEHLTVWRSRKASLISSFRQELSMQRTVSRSLLVGTLTQG